MNNVLYIFGFLIVSGCIYFTITHTSECYEIVFRQDSREDTFLVDKCNGRVWRMTQLAGHKGEPVIWDEMVVYDQSVSGNSGMRMDYDTFMKEYPSKDKGK